MSGQSQTGGSHRQFSIHFGGMVSRERGDAKSPQLRVAPAFLVVASFKEVSVKSALGCLKYSRLLCLSIGKYHILWPESCRGNLGGKPLRATSREPETVCLDSASIRSRLWQVCDFSLRYERSSDRGRTTVNPMMSGQSEWNRAAARGARKCPRRWREE